MQRIDTLRAISAHCRASHVSALFVVGWLTQGATEDELEQVLAAVHRAEHELGSQGHLAAYAERWGRMPDVRS
jgi:hypothetical protein